LQNKNIRANLHHEENWTSLNKITELRTFQPIKVPRSADSATVTFDHLKVF